MNRLNRTIAVVLFTLSSACATSAATGEGPENEPGKVEPAADKPAADQPVDSFAAQVAQGQKLYGVHCANCHGASGEGSPGPAVVGLKNGALPLEPRPGSARKEKFVTVADIGGFVMKTMPPNAPNSLSPDQYLAILAFDLKANGIELEQKLDLEKAKALTVPR
jgi:mono/diheme cytochrome c family protein